jgi:hypothetical protein
LTTLAGQLGVRAAQSGRRPRIEGRGWRPADGCPWTR